MRHIVKVCIVVCVVEGLTLSHWDIQKYSYMM